MSYREQFLDKISPIKFNKTPNFNGIVFDCETKIINNKHLIRYIYAIYVEKGLIVKQYEFFSKREFTDFLIKILESRKKLYVWAHNTNFDLRVGVDMAQFARRKFKIISFSTTPFILFLKKDDYSISFLDTFSFFKTSIEKLGKYFNVEKIQIDNFNTVDIDTLKLRCKRDVEVTFYILQYLYGKMINIVSVSAPSLSFKTFKTYLKYPLEKCNSQLAQNSYYGGRVEVFSKEKDYYVKYDVNSMYPYVMFTENYPEKLKLRIKQPTKKEILEYMKDEFGVIAKVKTNIQNTHINLIPYRRKTDNKLIFPSGKFETVVCSPEIDLNLISSITECEIYDMQPIFRKFITDYWGLREKSGGIMREYYKLVLNSLYGKFAQKSRQTSFHSFTNIDINGTIEVIDKDEKYKLKVISGMCFKQIEKERNLSTAISSFVTAHSRRELFNYLKKYEYDVIYCDTDMFVLPRGINVQNIGNGLGQLKIEGEGIGQFFTPKNYVFNDEIKIKGVKKNWNIQYSEDKIIAKGERFSGFLETLNKGEFGVNSLKVEKILTLVDDKRKWNKNKSSPIVI